MVIFYLWFFFLAFCPVNILSVGVQILEPNRFFLTNILSSSPALYSDGLKLRMPFWKCHFEVYARRFLELECLPTPCFPNMIKKGSIFLICCRFLGNFCFNLIAWPPIWTKAHGPNHAKTMAKLDLCNFSKTNPNEMKSGDSRRVLWETNENHLKRHVYI